MRVQRKEVLTSRASQPLLFRAVHRHPLKSGNPEINNHHELTSLTLACKLGRDLLFKEMLELSCKEFWRYSNICCSAYPLGALDSIRPSGETSKLTKCKLAPLQTGKCSLVLLDWGSAMMIILAGKKEEHLNMLEGGIIAKLLEEKWGTFAQVSRKRKYHVS